MQIKSKQRETTNKRNCEGTRGGGRWGFSSKCSWDIQVSHSVDWSPVKLHLHPQISGETALIQHWSGVYFPLEPGARGSGLLISTTPKKQQKGKNTSQTYSRWGSGRATIQKPEYTVHMVATIIGQTLRYSWSVRMYRPFLHSADCPIGKQLFCCCFLSLFFFLNHQKSLPAASVWICAHVCWREITGKLLPNQQQMYSS